MAARIIHHFNSRVIAFAETLLASVLIITLAAGCAARSEHMIPKDFTASRQNSGSVTVTVVDAREKREGKLTIAPETFARAIRQSIEASKLFGSVAPQGGTYDLRVGIIRVSQDTGPTAVAGMASRWTLTSAGKSDPLFDQVITKSYSAKFSEGATGDTRQRAANEGAAREVISEAIRKLSNLSP